MNARDYLQAQPLKYLPLLKYLNLYPERVTCHYADQGTSTGILLTYKTQSMPWDAANYPQTDRVFLPVASDERAAEILLNYFKDHYSLVSPAVFKFCEETTHAFFADQLSLHRVRTYLSYTSSRMVEQVNTKNVVVLQSVDDARLKLYACNGYTREEVLEHFANGAFSFAIYEGKEPVCACFIYRNFDTVWEIAAVHTLEHARRKGYARQVVASALQTVFAHGWVPRYHVDATNTASLYLAESLGLEPCLRFEHTLFDGIQAWSMRR
jgi:predicted GNAT family acetyltransferase